MSVQLRRLVGEPGELAALQRVLEGAPTYADRVTGHSPGPGDAQDLVTVLPAGVEPAEKFLWAVLVDADMVGCVDVIRGWPTPDTAHIGLLLLEETHTGRGLGRATYQAVEAQVRRWPRVQTVRAAVVATNTEVLAFWHRMGFTETGEVKPYRHDQIVSQSTILTKTL